MAQKEITISVPDSIYTRLQHAARATQQSFSDMVLRSLQVGIPPTWDDAPVQFQASLAALDRLDDDSLWKIAASRVTEEEMSRYEELLELNSNGVISSEEKLELENLRTEADLFMLRKAHAAALLRWRGHSLPPPDKL